MFLMRMINDSDLHRPPVSNSDFYFFRFDKPFLSSLSTAFVAYGFQSAFFPIYNSLEKKTYQNGMKFTFLGIGFCFIIYTIVMFVSLYSFGVDIQGDVLVNVESVTVWESYVLRAIFLLVMATHTPFIFFIGKESVLAIVALLYIRGDMKQEIDQSELKFQAEDDQGQNISDERQGLLRENVSQEFTNQPSIRKSMRNLSLSDKMISEGVDRNVSMALPFSKKVKKSLVISGSALKSTNSADLLPNWIYYTVTLIAYGLVIVAACVITDVEIVIKFIGSAANATLNVTFPGLFYFIIMRKFKINVPKWELILAFLLFLYGFIMGIFLTAINIWFTIAPFENDE